MSSKSFVKLLRKIIREEVRDAVRDTLTEQKHDHKQLIEHGINLSRITETPVSEQPVIKKQFTKNSMLNELLNETASTPSPAEVADWNAVNFRSEMADAFGISNTPKLVSNTGINGEAINLNNENVAATVNAMTRDYSALMKAMNKK